MLKYIFPKGQKLISYGKLIEKLLNQKIKNYPQNSLFMNISFELIYYNRVKHSIQLNNDVY